MGSITSDLRTDRFFIGGEWVKPANDATIDVIDSTTEDVLATVPQGTNVDVDRAVTAAAAAAEAWAATPVGQRAEMVAQLGEALMRRRDELAALESHEIGTPILESREAQVSQAVEFLRAAPVEAQTITWTERARTADAFRVPVGVAGAITAWNFPLQIVAAKAGAALTARCPIVVKVSEVTPLATWAFAEEAERVGFPPGVVNILTGYGPEAGAAIAAHPGIAKISFTGSVATAQAIAAAAAPSLKALHLELGGKSASVVLGDADLETAIKGSLSNAFQGSGQVCCATTRILVPASQLAQAEQIAEAAISQDWPVGNPLDEATRIGPLVSAAQQSRVLGYIDIGIAEGARLVCGGADRPAGLDRGFFVQPTVFSGTNELRISREEIFGPVVTLIGYRGGDDAAIGIANDSPYGLGGAVWSDDAERAVAVAKRLRTGQVEINGAAWDGTAPFGGFGSSGYGRENGRWGIEEYTTWQAVHR